jgi:hypothetical protein
MVPGQLEAEKATTAPKKVNSWIIPYSIKKEYRVDCAVDPAVLSSLNCEYVSNKEVAFVLAHQIRCYR